MNWLQIKFLAPAQFVEQWSDLLLTTGACAVTLDDQQQQALFEPTPGDTPLWEQVQIIALYNIDIDLVLLKQQIYKFIPQEIPLQIETLADQDWQNAWKQHFAPKQFANNLWICPSWCPIPEPNANNIILDPGLAFGTGTHPTTALCVEWLAEHMPANATVLDFGCGSGILGIAAAKLGASMVYCVDCDPQALASTKANAKNNQLSTKQLITYLPEELPATTKVTVVIANILANPLITLAKQLVAYTKPAGNLVLSGILSQQTASLLEVYSKYLEQVTITTKEEWVRISGKKICK